MARQIELKVGGIGYNGNQEGLSGRTFRALSSGTTADRVYFRVEANARDAATQVHGCSDKVGTAFIGPSDRAVLRDLGAVYLTENDVEQASISHRVLWLTPEA
ncbi:MAG: hypothetical protein AAGN82_06495 [Myxococcota bacterium]